jgi:hypothetical protein
VSIGLRKRVFQTLEEEFGPWEVDWFASDWSKRLPRFASNIGQWGLSIQMLSLRTGLRMKDSFIKGFIKRYMSKLGLGRKDALFPRSFQKGSRNVSVTYAVAYHGLEDLKERLGLDNSLKWHSFCIGSATKGTILGVRRTVVKGAGNWKSSAVDGYCRVWVHEEGLSHGGEEDSSLGRQV